MRYSNQDQEVFPGHSRPRAGKGIQCFPFSCSPRYYSALPSCRAQVLATLAVERLDPATWSIVAERREKIDWSAKDIQRHRFWITLCAATYAYEIEGADLQALPRAVRYVAALGDNGRPETVRF